MSEDRSGDSDPERIREDDPEPTASSRDDAKDAPGQPQESEGGIDRDDVDAGDAAGDADASSEGGDATDDEPDGSQEPVQGDGPDDPEDPYADERVAEGEGDEFAGTRERVADPDDWRLDERAEERKLDSSRLKTTRLTPEEEKKAYPFRLLFHLSAITGALLTVMASILHFAVTPIQGLQTLYVFLATGLVLLAVYAFPLARFPEKPPMGPPEVIARTRMYRKIILRSFGIAFALAFVTLVALEVVALMVGLKWLNMPMGSLLLARHFVLVPVVVVGIVLGALYTRIAIPSRQEKEPYEDVLVAVFTGLFALSAVVALFFASGIPAVVAWSGIEPRQAVYIAGVGLASAVLIANLRLRFPNVWRIVQEEVALSKEVDRPAAQTMQKRMMRNYIVALLFVVGSIAFLASRAAGLMRPGEGGNLDVVLIVYLGLGALFLGIIGVNYVQARQIGNRLIMNQSGKAGPGKKRYTPEQVTRYTVMGISDGIAFLLLIMMLLVSTGTLQRLGPWNVDSSYGTDFFVFAVIAAIGPFGFMWAREAARIRTIDEKFPDFLRDLAESQKAGMTLPRALMTAAQGAYGPLTKEIQIMASQVEWGVSFNEALERFAERTRTPLIERTVSLVREAASSGGNVVDILSAASDDAREIKNILVERKQQMGVYSMIIYIAFGVFLTVIGVLNSQFIPELAAAAGDAAGEQVGGIQFGNIDVDTYQRIFFHAALVQGIGGGLVSGVMTEGHPLAGLRHSVIMTMIAYIVFRFFIM